MTGPARAAFEAAARSWTTHLRSGGTTPWRAWAERPTEPATGGANEPVPGGATGELAGAAQLELLRRLNLAAGGPLGDHLVDHVLHRAGPGRGRPEQPLVWPADPTVAARSRSGAPVDPADLGDEDLLRVGTGVLVDLTLELPAAPAVGAAEMGVLERLGRRRTRSFRLEGAPILVADLRARLAAVGAAEHVPRRPWFSRTPSQPDLVVVVAAPLERMLFEAWSRRVQAGSARQWPLFVAQWERRGELPPSADVAALAARAAEEVGPENVHVLLTDHERVEDEVLLTRLLGVRPGRDGVRRAGDPAALSPVLVDVLRRHNAVLDVRVPGEEAVARVRTLVDLLHEVAPGEAAGLRVPRERRAWLARTADALAGEIAARGYAVHGDLATLSRPGGRGSSRPGREEVLAALLRVVLEADAWTRVRHERHESDHPSEHEEAE